MTGGVVIAAGGTGGHLVPAVAIAEEISRLEPARPIAFVGTRRALDDELVRGAGYEAHATSVRPFTRSPRGALAPLSMVPATLQARRILGRARAAVAVGMGGYPSLPVIVAARMGGIPSVIHEANAIPGLANEAAARFTANVAVSFAPALRAFRARAPRLVGVPLRAAIASFDRARLRPAAWSAFGLDPGRLTVLLFGGSLGAARLNAAAIGLAQRWRDRSDVQLLVATGRAQFDEVRAQLPVAMVALPFIERMDLAYAAADVAVARAGASTVAELAATGTPSILIPLPIARRREQDANAAEMAAAGGARVVADADAGVDRLAAELDAMCADPLARERMASSARAIARPHAAAEMAQWILELAAGAR